MIFLTFRNSQTFLDQETGQRTGWQFDSSWRISLTFSWAPNIGCLKRKRERIGRWLSSLNPTTCVFLVFFGALCTKHVSLEWNLLLPRYAKRSALCFWQFALLPVAGVANSLRKLVVSTHLKNILVKLDHFTRHRGENKTPLEPPPSLCFAIQLLLCPGYHKILLSEYIHDLFWHASTATILQNDGLWGHLQWQKREFDKSVTTSKVKNRTIFTTKKTRYTVFLPLTVDVSQTSPGLTCSICISRSVLTAYSSVAGIPCRETLTT